MSVVLIDACNRGIIQKNYLCGEPYEKQETAF